MATHAYQSLEEGGQIVVSDGPREDLEELARWVSIDVPEEKKLTAAEKKAAKAEAEAAAAAEPHVFSDDEPVPEPAAPVSE